MSIAKYPGKALIAFLVLGNIGLWVAFPPADDGTRPDFFRQYLGEMIGATMMLLMAVALLLSTRLRFLEPLFGGLDKVYAAHRNIGIIAGLPLPLHFLVVPLAEEIPPGRAPGYIAFGGLLALILLSLAPRLPVVRKLIRIPYRGWRISHRFIGIFFIMGTAHMLLVDALVRTTVVPFAVLMAAIATGIASYVYTEFIAKFLRRKAVYQVREVNRLTPTAVEIVLQPVKKPLKFTAGQFAFVRFKGNRVLSEPHPFTISSSLKENNLRLTIRASGDYTHICTII